jgi:hypothetical protein
MKEYLPAPSVVLKNLLQEYNEDDTCSPAFIIEQIQNIYSNQKLDKQKSPLDG